MTLPEKTRQESGDPRKRVGNQNSDSAGEYLGGGCHLETLRRPINTLRKKSAAG